MDNAVVAGNSRAFKPQALSNTVWAYTMTGESNPPLLDKVANSSVTIQIGFNSRALVNIG